MAKLFLLRHLKSQWNLDKEFAGWVDNPLSNEGILVAKEMAEKLKNEKIDVGYTSPLIRNMETVLRVFEYNPEKYPLFIHLDGGKMQMWGKFTDLNTDDMPVYVSEKLNERYYGKLQGLNKEEITKKYGEEKVHLWRRGYTERPPGGESLKDVYKRAIPFFKKYIIKELSEDKNVLVVASHNSLRAIVKFIENISDNDIADLELPFGSLIQYEFNGNFTIKR
ncbi:MAG: phosphoglycerate mutase [Candidatus Staskawiczbacteria bacterium]|nr:phosphoglycerate mutase [Candidatus Staskawiczbacteria bacterium]